MRYCRTIRDLRWAVAGTVVLLSITACVGPLWAAESGMHGRVIGLNEDGKVIGVVAGATIELKDQAGAVAGQATSGQDGYYKANVAPGQYLYKVTAEGYKDEDFGRGIALQSSDDLAVFNFSLTQGENDPQHKPPETPVVEIGVLQGRVLEKTPRGEVGIPGATVSLRGAPGAAQLTQVITAGPEKDGEAAGGYKVVLEAGSWRASAAAEGFETFVDPDPIPIASGETTTRDFVLTRIVLDEPENQGIQGTVSVRDPSRKPSTPLPWEAFILPLAGGPRIGPISSGPGGTYSSDLDVGHYRVVVVAEGYQTARAGPAEVFAGQYTVVDLVLVPLADEEEQPPPPTSLVFEGLVQEQTSGRASQPLPGASVLLRKQGDGLGGAPRAITGKDGKVRIEVQQAGDYVALAQKQGYKPSGARVTIDPQGTNLAVITLTKEDSPPEPEPRPEPRPELENVAVSGYVVYQDPASQTGYYGVAGAETMWQATGVQERATSQKSGGFNLELPEGTYQVSVKAPAGYQGTTEQVVVRRGMRPKHFVLNRLDSGPEPATPGRQVTVRGVVMTRSQRAFARQTSVPGATLEWKRATGIGILASSVSVASDARGAYSATLRPGLYDVTVRAKGFAAARERVQVTERMGTKNFTIVRGADDSASNTNPNTGQVTLNVRVLRRSAMRLRSSSAQPVPGARVAVVQNNREIASGTTDSRGSKSMRLPRGTYVVRVSHQSYGQAQETVALTGGTVNRDIYLSQSGTQPGLQPAPQPAALNLRIVGASRGTKPGQPSRLQPLSAARITISQNGKQVTSGQSDKLGSYTTQLKTGTYQVDISHQGYRSTRQTIAIQPGGVTRQIVLTPQSGVIETPPIRNPGIRIPGIGIPGTPIPITPTPEIKTPDKPIQETAPPPTEIPRIRTPIRLFRGGSQR